MSPHLTLLERLFPVPHALAMPGIGVDVSDESIKFIELRRSSSGFRLGVYDDVAIPQGVVEAGVIKKKDDLVAILRPCAKRFPSERVFASLPEEQAYIVRLALPLAARSHLRESIELQLEEHVPLPPHDVVFDYEILHPADASPSQIDLVVSAFPAALAAHYEDVFAQSGLVLAGTEIEAQAIARSLVRMGDEGTFMIIDFGKTRTGLSIVSQGSVRFTTTIKFGGNEVTRVLQKAKACAFDAAEKLKKEKGLLQNNDKETYEAVLLSLGVLRDEISKHYLFWNTHRDENGKERKKIERLVLCGGGADLLGLPEYLAQSLNADVEMGNPWINVFDFNEHIPSLHAKKAIEYTTAIGLALRSSAGSST